jgi:hypothetical protein
MNRRLLSGEQIYTSGNATMLPEPPSWPLGARRAFRRLKQE